MKYFVKVNKKPYREGDHLAFKVFINEDHLIAGALLHQRTIEHFERLGYGDEDATGTRQNVISKEETEHVIYFDLGDNYEERYLTGIANDIVSRKMVYKDQYAAFIEHLKSNGYRVCSE